MNVQTILKQVCASLLGGALMMPAAAFAEDTLEEALATLTTQEELPRVLNRIKRRAFRRVKVGPLIKNGGNGGLINIDIPLDPNLPINQSVCGPGASPSVRRAVVCTIEANGRGNVDPARIGYSTQGRELLAARIGNRRGARVLVITQQHGNEVASTEAALEQLKRLSRGFGRQTRQILRRLDILFIMRANPDGGDPAPECPRVLPVGAPFLGACALTRQNVDPTAGGGFLSDSEPDFFGVVGQGYNLNRYHYVGLDTPIRPVENQAMVAAAIAFRPDYVLDLHGDVPKTDCVLDLTTIVPNAVFGILPSVECQAGQFLPDLDRQFSIFAEAHADPQRNIEARALGAAILERTQRETNGTVGRFSQLQLGAGALNVGTADAYQLIGAVTGGWESTNFGLESRPDVQAVVNGQPVISANTFLVDGSNLAQQLRLNNVALRKALSTIARFQRKPPTDEGSFCSFPLATGLNGRLPPELFPPNTPGVGFEFVIPFVPAIGVPISINGACPGD